ncbi:MsnO8 family LLM class oxidoreductase, partial [Leucobacter sp. M11]|uniref:MsnO8 family LLM class oxidoreductase n=1 Tax=Leucobacter sp. M11 TaxID=2993565 RepID=UPI002D80AE54
GATFRALRRTVQAAEAFPSDVQELQRYLSDELPVTGVNAYPGRGTRVPLFILGSSMFGASLGAQLGLPYAFASHFAPQQLLGAMQHYRETFRPSAQQATPYAMAAINVLAAETDEAAADLFHRSKLSRVRMFLSRGREQMLTEAEAEQLVDSPAGQEIVGMMRYTAVGSPKTVREQLHAFAEMTGADELITVHPAPTPEERLTSIRLAGPTAQEPPAEHPPKG